MEKTGRIYRYTTPKTEERVTFQSGDKVQPTTVIYQQDMQQCMQQCNSGIHVIGATSQF